MGSLANLEIGEVITARTYKVVPGAAIAWANTYEIVSRQPITDMNQSAAALDTLKNVIATFERSILHGSYTLDRIVFSTYVPDGRPYDPYTFTSFSVNLPGQYAPLIRELLPLQFCALVKRVVSFGRQGNLLFRGIVTAVDATVTASGAVIKSTRLSQIQSALNSFVSELANRGFDLAMARGTQQVETSTLRLVSELLAKADMRFKQLNNRYFDVMRN